MFVDFSWLQLAAQQQVFILAEAFLVMSALPANVISCEIVFRSSQACDVIISHFCFACNALTATRNNKWALSDAYMLRMCGHLQWQ
jgi:hypothetical protein